MDEPVLKQVWDADVPASDPRFELAVMRRIDQRRFRRELAMTVTLTMAAIALLVLVMPDVEFSWRESLAPNFGNLAILGLLTAVTLLVPLLWPAED